MNILYKKSFFTAFAVSLVLSIAGPMSAFAAGPAAVNLLTAGNFVILSKSGITNIPTSVITGNIGTTPAMGAAITGLGCPEVTGTIYSVDATGPTCKITDPALLNTARIAMEAAYTDAAGRTSPTATELGGGNIGGMILTPGLYKWNTDVTIATDITLSGGPNDVWIFQITGNLNVFSAGSIPAGVKILLTGGAQASNVFWQVGGGSGATLGTYSTFNGTILSATQVIMRSGAILNGRALAQTQITLDTNTITVPTTANTTVVTPNNMNGWWFFEETPSGSGAFVSGPSTPPLGIGSAQLTINGTGGEIFGSFAYAGTRLDTITSLAYSTYRSSGSSALAPSLQLDIDTDVTDANTAWQGRLVYEPYYTHTVSTGAWQRWNTLDNAGTGNWWFSGAPGNAVCPINNPCTWTELLSAFPNAGVRSPIPNTGAIQFKAGGGWTGGFVGSVDGFSIGVNNMVTTYDFDSPSTAILHVIKRVINTNGGVATSTSFTVHVQQSGSDVAGSPALGQDSPGNAYTLTPNTYIVSENANASYIQSFTGACDSSGTVTLLAGDDKICTITNTDVPPLPATLHVIKLVINSSSGASIPSDFNVSVKLSGTNVVGSPAVGTSTPGTLYSLSAGTYIISENANASYIQSFTGACDSSGTVTLLAGDDKICTIIDTDIPLPVVVPPSPPSSPSAPSSNGGGGGSSGGGSGSVISLPLINIIKVPSPLALPSGPGSVTYTYTVTNVGAVPMRGIWVKDDTCNPVTFISGDSNNDSLLDGGEVWMYRCTQTVSKTITNTATAHGQASGIDGYAVALATVVVGTPLPIPNLPNTGLLPPIPPLINIAKVPSRLIPFPFGGGDVTYTYTVTNPGVVPISNVVVTDDKCALVSNVSGDTNGNKLLDQGEAWMYTCRTHVAVSTRNIATVEGRANGLIALGYAFNNVLVSSLGLPSTGLLGKQIKTITVDLRKGSRGTNVTILQQFLMSENKGTAADALIRVGATTYFGDLTRAALAEFQARVGISPAIGNFGTITRNYIQVYY